MADKQIAILKVLDVGRMHKKGRKDIAKWLRRMADDLEKLGDGYGKGWFRARYLIANKDFKPI